MRKWRERKRAHGRRRIADATPLVHGEMKVARSALTPVVFVVLCLTGCGMGRPAFDLIK